jgi:DNA-binding NtrC family response regulator
MDVLIVEDDELQRKVLYDLLKKKGHSVKACDCLSEARTRLAADSANLLFLDRRLPDGDGLKEIPKLMEINPDMRIVVITAYADVPSVVTAIQSGAYDFLPKPFDQDQLWRIIRNLEQTLSMQQKVSGLSRLTVDNPSGEVWQLDEMIGSEKLQKTFEQAKRIAEFPDTTVLLLGESGTGKGIMAKAIHRISQRADKPFVDVNCSAIPANLMESEIFGYEKGAFTDAKSGKAGLLEIADGGTVFLDEIGDMDLLLQSKLLKVIEDKAFRRLGGSKTVQVDIRIVAATCRDIKQMVKDGKFREDLFYRLSVFPLTIPPLREHKETIPILAENCLNSYAKTMGRKIKGFTPEAMKAMMAYSWPGNVRELRNSIERGVILCKGDKIDTKDLCIPKEYGPQDAETSCQCSEQAANAAPQEALPMMSLEECEKQMIIRVLQEVDGHKGKAAEILQIHRSTLHNRMAKFGLNSENCN